MALKRRTLGQKRALHKPDWKPTQTTLVQKNTGVQKAGKTFKDFYIEADLKENPYTKNGKKRTKADARQDFNRKFARRKKFVQEAKLSTEKYSDEEIAKEVAYERFRGKEKKSQFEKMYTQWTEARFKGTPEEIQGKKLVKVNQEQWKGVMRVYGDLPIDGIQGHQTFNDLVNDPSSTYKDIEEAFRKMQLTQLFKERVNAYYEGDDEWEARYHRFGN